MSEHEEPLRDRARLAEEYNRLKEEVSQLDERAEQAQRAYQTARKSFSEVSTSKTSEACSVRARTELRVSHRREDSC